MVFPRQIKRISSSLLQVKWSDGREDKLASIVLRRNCPCASCLEHRGELNHSKPLSAKPAKSSSLSIISNTIEEETSLLEVWGIGNYALGCRWGDGHSAGIYTFNKLREIGDSIAAAKTKSDLKLDNQSQSQVSETSDC